MKNIKNKFKQISPEYTFLMLALVFGILFLFVIPPMTAPDEIGHFAKSYAFSEGKIIPYFLDSATNPFKTWGEYGFNLPQSIVDLNNNSTGIGYNITQHFNYGSLDSDYYENLNKAFVPLGGQLNYSFFQYIPQIIGIFISKYIFSSVLWIYYTARIFNFICYVLVIFLAVKVTKFAKWSFVLLALNPMFLFLSVSTSGDAFTNAVAFLFVALLSQLIFDAVLDKKKLYISFGMLVAMIQMKPTLIMFGLLYFLIPNQRFTIKSKMIYGSLILFSSLFIYYIWGKLFPNQDTMYVDFAHPSAQIRHIMEDPLAFLVVIKNTLVIHGKFLLHSHTGQFGLLNRNISFLAVLIYYMLILFSVFIREDDSMKVTKMIRFVSLLFLIGYTLLTFVALYQIWTPVGFDHIQGLQGRYFIPMGTIALLAVAPNKISCKKNIALPITILGIILFLGYTILFLSRSYGFMIL